MFIPRSTLPAAPGNQRCPLILAIRKVHGSTLKAPEPLDEGYALLDLDHAFGRAGPDLPDLFDYFSRKFKQRLGMGRLFPSENRRLPLVAGTANFGVKLNATKEVDVELFGRLLGAAAG